jgi:hypothetical protein
MAGREQARDIDEVFDADGHAMRGSALATRHALGLGSPGRVYRRITVKPNEDISFGKSLSGANVGSQKENCRRSAS